MLIEQNPSRADRIKRAITLKCPNCGFGKVFYPAKFPGMRPKMRETCEHCGYKFADREEGFFRGAVYLSYGLTLLEGLLACVVAKVLIFGLSDRDVVLIALTAMLFCSFWNYRLARVLWLNMNAEKGSA